MPGRWKARKSKPSVPALSTAPWESRKSGEIPTFPQRRPRFPSLKPKNPAFASLGLFPVKLSWRVGHFRWPKWARARGQTPLGELLATEYVNAETSFVVPLNKLRWKADRQMPMHGNDVIGVDTKAKPVRVLKGECKSRVKFSDDVAEKAAVDLDKHDGRPNPSTLAFITKRLYEEKRDAEAKVFQDLQCKGSIANKDVTHMIFALSGNDPAKDLAAAPKSKHKGISRENAAIMISDHGAFVAAVYKTHGA
jgi:Cap4 SAVED domain